MTYGTRLNLMVRIVVASLALALTAAACSATQVIDDIGDSTEAIAEGAVDPAPTAAATPTIEPSGADDTSTSVPTSEPPADATPEGVEAERESDAADNDDLPPSDDDFLNDFLEGLVPEPGPRTVEVIAVGAEPRIELRIVATEACQEVLDTQASQRIDQRIAGSTSTLVDVDSTVTSTVSSRPVGDGQFEVTEVLGEIRAFDKIRSTETDISELFGTDEIVLRYRLDELGDYVDGSMVASGLGTTPALADVFTGSVESVVTYPEEAIGIGGQWEQRSTLVQQGLDVQVVQRLTVVDLSDDFITLDLEVTQSVAKGSRIDEPMSGLSFVIERWEGVGEGRLVLDRASLMPAIATSTIEVEQRLRVDTAGMPDEVLDQTVVLEVDQRSQLGAACEGRSERVLP